VKSFNKEKAATQNIEQYTFWHIPKPTFHVIYRCCFTYQNIALNPVITLLSNIFDIFSPQMVIWNIGMGNRHFWG